MRHGAVATPANRRAETLPESCAQQPGVTRHASRKGGRLGACSTVDCKRRSLQTCATSVAAALGETQPIERRGGALGANAAKWPQPGGGAGRLARDAWSGISRDPVGNSTARCAPSMHKPRPPRVFRPRGQDRAGLSHADAGAWLVKEWEPEQAAIALPPVA